MLLRGYEGGGGGGGLGGGGAGCEGALELWAEGGKELEPLIEKVCSGEDTI